MPLVRAYAKSIFMNLKGDNRLPHKLGNFFFWVVASTYALARLGLFLGTPTVTSQDTYAWLSPNDPVSEILQNRSNRPGLLFQMLLRITSFSEQNVDIAVDYSEVDAIFAVSWFSLIISIVAYVYLAIAIVCGVTTIAAARVVFVAVLALSLLPSVYVWDRFLMSESVSGPLLIMWLASIIVTVKTQDISSGQLWKIAIFGGLALLVRPSSFVLIAPLSTIVLVSLVLSFPRARWISGPNLTLAAFVVGLGVWTTLQVSYWAEKVGFIAEANRATALLRFPEFVDLLEESSGKVVCGSAVNFAENEWELDRHGQWGGVTEASRDEVSAEACLGEWSALGAEAPSFAEIAFSPTFLLSWLGSGFPNASSALPGGDDQEILGLSFFELLPELIVHGVPFLTMSILFTLGFVLATHAPKTELPTRELFFSSTLFIGNLATIIVFALVDGGDSFRHPIPHNQIHPILALYLGLVWGSPGLKFLIWKEWYKKIAMKLGGN